MPLEVNPAPGELQIVLDLVNSADRKRKTEALKSPAALADWLAGQGLLAPATELSRSDLERMLAVRQGLGAMLRANSGVKASAEAIARLDRLASQALLRVRFAADGTVSLEPAASGVDGILARLAGIVHAATLDGQWPRLKVCFNQACRQAFYDFSKNRAGVWCSMRRCGSQLNSQRYRQRYKRVHGRTPLGGYKW